MPKQETIKKTIRFRQNIIQRIEWIVKNDFARSETQAIEDAIENYVAILQGRNTFSPLESYLQDAPKKVKRK